MKSTATLLAIACLASACTSTRSAKVPPKQYLLRETVNTDGDEIRYTLHARGNGKPEVVRTRKHKFGVATLGVQTESVSQKLADATDLTAWRGLIVERVVSGSAAARAGILKGDVLVKLNETQLSAPKQLKDLLEHTVEPDAEVTLSVLQVSPNGSYPVDPTEIAVTLTPKDVSVTESDTTALETDLGIFRLTGLQVGTLDSKLGEEIYDTAAPAVLVAGSMIGSPAYKAGLRSGDRVITCDGQPVISHEDISRAVLARARGADIPAEWFAPELRMNIPEQTGNVQLEVEGPLGRHTASLAVDDDLEDEFEFYIPIIIDYESDIRSTSVSFLDFIFQFGFNYEDRYRASNTRSTANQSLLSLFPLGMFEFEHSPGYSRYCFFWIIEFEDYD